MTSLTKEERQVVARRIFEALCTHYPDRYIALFEQPGSAEASVPDTSSANAIANSPVVAPHWGLLAGERKAT
jgi:hypothetical protein